MEKLHCDITPTQAEEVIRHMTADQPQLPTGAASNYHRTNAVPVMEFFSRFVVTYGGRTKRGSSSSSSSSSSGLSPEVESLLHVVGRAIILAWRREGRGGSGGYSEGGVSALPSMFQALDTDHSGYLSIDELKRGLRSLPLEPSVSEAALDELVTHVDADGNGRINLLEFLKAFSVADKVSHHRSPS